MLAVRTEIDIDAPPSRVWQILTAFQSYDDWNPVVQRVRAELRTGGSIRFVLPYGGIKLPIAARLINVEPERELRWKGPSSDLLGSIFRAEHYLRLKPLPDQRTRLIHGEQFGGLFPQALWGRLRSELLPRYNGMNEALKRRAEAG